MQKAALYLAVLSTVCLLGLLGYILGMGLPTIVAFSPCALPVAYLPTIIHLVVSRNTWFNMVAFTLATHGIRFALEEPGIPETYELALGQRFFHDRKESCK